jgi:hypothetical protein
VRKEAQKSKDRNMGTDIELRVSITRKRTIDGAITTALSGTQID